MRWAYIREIWDFGSTIEIEEKHTGRYGAKGQEREEKRKATPEEIAKQNQWRRQRDVRRLIKWNFSPGDYWMTLTYKKGDRPTWEQMKKDLGKLIRKVRTKYRKKGWELKYIYRLAIGKKGGPHVHLLVNREADQETGTDRIVSELWENGHVYFASLYDAGGYVKLSEYTLNAIPVTFGGNVTIDGQQYIADYVDVERGKLVKMVDSSKLDNTQSIVDKTEWLLAEQQEIDLIQEEVQALKTLATYYPTTNIFINSEQLDGYTVFNYPISMANGWNYVKKQLNDNRDYIYDMDTQLAEAYVNSEYAVALTELEV